MFFDRENEPDLGDERRGCGRDNVDFYGNDIDDDYQTAYPSTTIKLVDIPIKQLLMSEQELTALFIEWAAADKLAKETKRRNDRIAELETELKALKAQ